MTDQRLRQLSRTLGVSVVSLIRLGLGWDGQAFTFPMKDKKGQVVGIRRRFLSGPKSSVKGSRSGLFIPQGLSGEGPLLICEGPTDTCAGLDLGYDAIGRPNCNSCTDITARYVRGRSVTIIGDNDEQGRFGAERLSAVLVLYCPQVRLLYPARQIKDLRQWLSTGLTPEAFARYLEENGIAQQAVLKGCCNG
jgi:hypothetical protein